MLTTEQLIERKNGIGGSDAAAICGLSKWKTPLDVYLDKTSDEIINNENEFMYWGNVMEPLIIKEYRARTGKEVLTDDTLFKHKDYEWMAANIDGKIFADNAILECKTSSAYADSEWGEENTDNFPTEYILQCAHYAIVLDADYVDLAVLIGGNQFRVYKYTRNEQLEKNLIAKEKKFWEEHVLKRVAPSPINSEDALKLWRKSNGEMITATQDAQIKIQNIERIKALIKEMEAEKSAAELEIKKIIKEADGIADEFGKALVTWKTRNSNRFDVQRFKEKHPDFYSEFLTESSTRTFLIRR